MTVFNPPPFEGLMEKLVGDGADTAKSRLNPSIVARLGDVRDIRELFVMYGEIFLSMHSEIVTLRRQLSIVQEQLLLAPLRQPHSQLELLELRYRQVIEALEDANRPQRALAHRKLKRRIKRPGE